MASSTVRETGIAATLFALALSVRLPLLGAAPYGDEAAHYAMARTLGFLDSSIYWIDLDIPFQLYPLTLGRPLFVLLHAPGAALGFTAFRFLGIVYAAALAPLVYALVRRCGARQAASALGGAAVALLPPFVVWGARTFPDTAMAALVLVGLWAWVAGRVRLASGILFAACLTKETAIPAVAGLAVYAVASGIRQRLKEGKRWAALLPERAEVWISGVVALGPIGVLASYMAVPKLPGWTSGGTLGGAAETLALSSWLIVGVAIAAVLVPRSRSVAAAFGGTLAFYAVFIVVRGGGINGWYAILPGALAICAAAIGIDAGLRSLRWPRPAAGIAAGAAGLAAVLAITGFGASLTPAFHPLDPRGEPGLAASLRFVRDENAWLLHAIEFQQSERPAEVLEMDLAWFWIAYPFSGRERTTFSYTISYDSGAVPIHELVQRGEASDLTWMQDWNSTFQQTFKQTYEDCLVFSEWPLLAYRLRPCAGREAVLSQDYQARLAAGSEAPKP